MKHYLEQTEDVLREVGSCQQGLSTGEAEARLAKNGRNKLAEAKKDSLIKRFFQQMADPMIIILLVAAAISAAASGEARISSSARIKRNIAPMSAVGRTARRTSACRPSIATKPLCH